MAVCTPQGRAPTGKLAVGWGSGVSPSKEELEFLEQEQRAARDRLRYFQDLQTLVTQCEAQAAALTDAGAAYDAGLAKIVEIQRRNFAATRERDMRLGGGIFT